ncbi:MAG: hypothetical protein AMXMBFR56_72570 [Polyangiaceae bacterium]
MRTIAAGDSQILSATGAERGARVRVSIKDNGGTFRDLTTYPEEDFVDSVSWGEDVDSPGMTASATLRRAVGDKSLAPLHETSPLNKGWNPGGAYAALLELGREVKIEAGVTRDLEGTPDNWLEVFRGYVDSVDWAGETVQVECSGLEAKLRDTWIETERVYAHATGAGATKGLRSFELNRAYVLNELVLPSEGKLNGRYYKVTTAGTTSTTVEPTWPTSGTVTSGTVTFTYENVTTYTVGTAVETVMQQILDDNLGAAVVSLYTPTTPGWAVRGFQQQRQSLWDALNSLATQIGWELRYRWDSGTSAFRLTFRDVDRAKTTPDATIGTAEVMEVTTASKQVAVIRNAVRVIYGDSANRNPSGEPIRAVIDVTDSSSITKYGRRFCELVEGTNSNIDTSTEATALANAVLSDLKEPLFDWAVTLRFYPWLQLADLLRFSPNCRHFSSQQDLALISVRHAVEAGYATTEVQTRGKPSTGHAKWLAREGRVIPMDVHQTQLGNPGGTTTLQSLDTVGGRRFITTQSAESKTLAFCTELHVSESAGFSPSSSTLKASGQNQDATVTDLIPGKTYYAKVVPYRRNGTRLVRGLPSAEVSFVAGQAKAGHLVADVDWGRVPLNGSFETQTDAAGPPDHWALTEGAWSTDLELLTGSGAITGDSYLHVKSGTTQRGMETDFFEVVSTHNYSLQVFAKGISGTGNLKIAVQWYLSNFTYDSENGILADATATSWAEQRYIATPPAGIKFAKIKIYKETPSTAGAWHVDSVRFVDVGESWIAPTYNGSWIDVGGAWMAGGYYRDPLGRIHLRGLAKWNAGGPLAATIFTLPVGYRPSASLQYPVRMGTGVFSYLTIDSAGVVQYGGGVLADAQGSITLDGVHFDTR